jgi:hypothetical protein
VGEAKEVFLIIEKEEDKDPWQRNIIIIFFGGREHEDI